MNVERTATRTTSPPAQAITANPAAGAQAPPPRAPETTSGDRYAKAAAEKTSDARKAPAPAEALAELAQVRQNRLKKAAPSAGPPLASFEGQAALTQEESAKAANAMQGLESVSKLLLGAAGSNGVLSRKEASKLIDGLRKDGRDTEALAAEQVYRKIDEHDSGRGSKITREDFSKAAPLFQQWFGRGEGNSSALGQTLRSIGQAAPAPGADPAQKAAQFAKQLEKLADGLTFTSETDAPYKAFSRPLPPGTALTPQSLVKALGLPDNTPASSRSFDEYFNYAQDPDTGNPDEVRAQHKLLAEAMKKGLTDVQILYLYDSKVIEAPVYLVGRTPDGQIAGLETMRVWT